MWRGRVSISLPYARDTDAHSINIFNPLPIVCATNEVKVLETSDSLFSSALGEPQGESDSLHMHEEASRAMRVELKCSVNSESHPDVRRQAASRSNLLTNNYIHRLFASETSVREGLGERSSNFIPISRSQP